MSETDELSMLFSEEQVGSYVVKGWTLRQFQALLPIIMTAIEALKEHGVTWEDLGEDQEKTMEALQVAVKALIPQADRILSISLEIPEELAGNLDLASASVLLLKVISKNVEHLKNLPARLMAMVETKNPGDSLSSGSSTT
jgi:hypothetical protein